MPLSAEFLQDRYDGHVNVALPLGSMISMLVVVVVGVSMDQKKIVL